MKGKGANLFCGFEHSPLAVKGTVGGRSTPPGLSRRQTDQNSSVLVRHDNGLHPTNKGALRPSGVSVGPGANTVTGDNYTEIME